MQDNRNKGLIEASNDITYLDLLKEAKERSLSFMDFFYQEKQEVGQKKKIVEDIIYGDNHRIALIVDLLESTNKKHKPTTFNLNQLMITFGEKTGRLVLESLFTGKKIFQKDLCEAAYKFLWKNFRESLICSDEEQRKKRYLLKEGVKLFHYTIDLLILANLLGD